MGAENRNIMACLLRLSFMLHLKTITHDQNLSLRIKNLYVSVLILQVSVFGFCNSVSGDGELEGVRNSCVCTIQ